MKPINLMIILIVAGAVLMLSLTGCTKSPETPVYVTSTLPEIPAECDAVCPLVPRLPDQDIRADAAARDRNALKGAYRCEQHARAACVARLKVLLPEGGR